MSLNWDITRIENFEEVCWLPLAEEHKKSFLANPWATYTEDEETGEIRYLNPVTDALIWSMMTLGCKGKITEKNVDLVIKQVAILQRVRGPMLFRGGKPRYITPDEVRAHIGLGTNCGSYGLRHFKKCMWEDLERGAVEWLERVVKNVEVEEAA